MSVPLLIWPVPIYKDGRKPVITDSYGYSEERGRLHAGIDIMYPRIPSDGGVYGVVQTPEFSRKSFMPFGIPAVAVADGKVKISALIGTGFQINLDHGSFTSQYFHLRKSFVREGQTIVKGQPLGEIGFNPIGYKLSHLHFQIKIDGNTVDPAPFFTKAQFVHNPWRNSIRWGVTTLGLLSVGWLLYKRKR